MEGGRIVDVRVATRDFLLANLAGEALTQHGGKACTKPERKRWGLPVALGLITAVLLVAALWPKETPQRTLVVAARDLGAGTTLAAADLTTAQVDAAAAPADAVADPARLVGQTLAVVRFAGEPVTPRHIGPAVTLAPDERGIAVKVQADTGLAGLLRPGMKVGMVATLADGDRDIYAKSLLEGLRVVYVSPDFQARPYTPATASATVTKSGRRRARHGQHAGNVLDAAAAGRCARGCSSWPPARRPRPCATRPSRTR